MLAGKYFENDAPRAASVLKQRVKELAYNGDKDAICNWIGVTIALHILKVCRSTPDIHVQVQYVECPCTELQCAVLYCTVLYCSVLCHSILHCTVRYCAVLCCTVLYCIVLYCTVLYMG